MAQVFLHIGQYKTGTTAVQDTLYSNRAALAQQGYIYPGALLRGTAHFRLSDNFFNSPRAVEERLAQNLPPALSSDSDAFVFSNEGLSGYSTLLSKHDELGKLWRLLAHHFQGCDLTVVTYVRPQVAAIESRIIQSIKGFSKQHEIDMGELLAPSSPVNYLDFAERLQAAFPAAKLLFRVFDRSTLVGGDVVDDFCAATGIDASALDRPKTEPNVSPSGAFVRYKMLSQTPSFAQVFAQFGVSAQRMDQLAYMYCEAEGQPKAVVFDSEVRTTIQQTFAATNAAFARQFLSSEDAETFLDRTARPVGEVTPNLELSAPQLLDILARAQREGT
ncbi:MAG: hypothetical protein AAF218_07360 [Pseudomonadota bacterium]